jgi:hypothetical protein
MTFDQANLLSWLQKIIPLLRENPRSCQAEKMLLEMQNIRSSLCSIIDEECKVFARPNRFLYYDIRSAESNWRLIDLDHRLDRLWINAAQLIDSDLQDLISHFCAETARAHNLAVGGIQLLAYLQRSSRSDKDLLASLREERREIMLINASIRLSKCFETSRDRLLREITESKVLRW